MPITITVQNSNPTTKLGKILKERNISQADLLRLIKEKTGCNLTKASVSKYVCGKYTSMSTVTLKILATTLSINHLEDLVEGFPK